MVSGEFGLVSWRDTVLELRSARFYRDVVCEFTISLVLLFVDLLINGSQADLFTTGIVCGLYVFLLIEAFGHVQGALQNPVVTLAFVCTKRLSVIKGICYIAAQISGGTAGAYLAKACMSPLQASYVFAFSPGVGVTSQQAIVGDGVITAGLIFVTLGALDERFRKVYMPGFPIGLALSFGIIAGGPITGGCMNPCIATTFANVSHDWSNLWVFWVGDYLGGSIAIFLYWFYTYDGWIFSSQRTQTLDLQKTEAKTGNTESETGKTEIENGSASRL